MLTQGVEVATGLQNKFDWAGVAGGAVAGGIASGISANIGGAATQFTQATQLNLALSGAAAAIAGAATRSLATGSDFGDNIMRALPDVVGSTIGNLVTNGIAAPQSSFQRLKQAGGVQLADSDQIQSEASPEIVITAKRLNSLQKATYDSEQYLDQLAAKITTSISDKFKQADVSIATYARNNTVNQVLSYASSQARNFGNQRLAGGIDQLAAVDRGLFRVAPTLALGAVKLAAGAVGFVYDLATNTPGTVKSSINALDSAFMDTGAGKRFVMGVTDNYNDLTSGNPTRIEAGTLRTGVAAVNIAAVAIPGAEALAGLRSEAFGATAVGAAETEAPLFSRIAPNGGLAADEAAGGHLLLKHVGQSEADLMARLAAEPKITGSSSFYDRAVAESAVSDAIDGNAGKISDWLSGSSGRLKIEYTGQSPVGITVARGASGAVDVSSFRLILVRNPSMPAGYHILTGFPIKP